MADLPGLIAFTVLCLADWVLIQDLGFFGGVGTDPNSMIPFIVLAAAGYLALTRQAGPARRAADLAVVEVASAEANPRAEPRRRSRSAAARRPAPMRSRAAHQSRRPRFCG